MLAASCLLPTSHQVPLDLQINLPGKLTDSQLLHLAAAAAVRDRVVCLITSFEYYTGVSCGCGISPTTSSTTRATAVNSKRDLAPTHNPRHVQDAICTNCGIPGLRKPTPTTRPPCNPRAAALNCTPHPVIRALVLEGGIRCRTNSYRPQLHCDWPLLIPPHPLIQPPKILELGSG